MDAHRIEPAEHADVEEVRGVRVLLAVESGPRAWGIPCAERDHEVRFVYVRPRDDYLSLLRRLDVIDLPGDRKWNMAGWDARKALTQAVRGETAPVELLASPIGYREATCVAARLFADAVMALTPTARLFFRYLHASAGHLDEYRQSGQVRKLLYSLREAAACRWIERHVEPGPAAGAVGRPVPVDLFALLADCADEAVADVAAQLVEATVGADVNGRLPATRIVEDHVTVVLAAGERTGSRLARRPARAARQAAWDRADAAFRAIVAAAKAMEPVADE